MELTARGQDTIEDKSHVLYYKPLFIIKKPSTHRLEVELVELRNPHEGLKTVYRTKNTYMMMMMMMIMMMMMKNLPVSPQLNTSSSRSLSVTWR